MRYTVAMKPGQLLDSLGIDVITSMLEDGLSMPEVAERLGVARETLRDWTARSDARSGRVRGAVAAGAEAWERRARQVLDDALAVAQANPTIAGAVVALAREKAQACWRSAAVRDPGRYDARRGGGDVNVNLGVQVNGVPQPARRLSTAELVRIAQAGLTDRDDGERSITSSSTRDGAPPPGPPSVDGAAGPIHAGAPSPDVPQRFANFRNKSVSTDIIDVPSPANFSQPGAS